MAVVLVFGSVACGDAGAGSDVDLLVLGDVSALKLSASLKPAGRALGRAVHAIAFTIESLKNSFVVAKALRERSCGGHG